MNSIYYTLILPNYIKYCLSSPFESYLLISPYNIKMVIDFLSKNTNSLFKSLVDISAADYPERANRFEINYHLLSIKYNTRLNIKTYLDEVTDIESITMVYKNANWSERELWDLFGIYFKNNDDLRRILTDYGFEGHPLRKDFPLTGYYEVLYDNNSKIVSTQLVETTQEFRLHQYNNSWI